MIKFGIKTTVIALVVVAGAGFALFGTDLVSYVRSGTRTVRESVKDAVPTEFELARAGDLLDEIIPEMQANIRLMATEEVEIAALEADINAGRSRLTAEQTSIGKLSHMLAEKKASFDLGGRRFSRAQLKRDLARRFDRFKEAETVLAGKERLLESRRNSLQAAMTMLERTRAQKQLLEEKVAALGAQHQLVKAAAVGSKIHVDGTQLAKADKLISDLKRRLDIAERVLAHEARFTEPIPLDVITEGDLLTQISDHFGADTAGSTTAMAMTPPAGDTGETATE